MKGDITMSRLYTLATKLHDTCCPKCNGRCHCGSPCLFNHEAEETDWKENVANSYFLDLAKKATAITAETHLTDEQFVEYASGIPYGNDIPAEVYAVMIKHGFFD